MSDEKEFGIIVEESARGGYYLFVGNTLSTIILFLSSTIVAQLLGPENYGVFSLVIAVPSLLIGLSEFGVSSAITKFLAEFRIIGKKSDSNRVMKSGLLLSLVFGVIATVVCFVFSDELSTYLINMPEATGYVKFASLLVLFQTLFNALVAIFVGLDKMANNSIIMIVRAVVKLVLSVALLLLGFNITGALIGHVACYVVAVGVGLLLIVFKLGLKLKSDSSNSDVLKLLLKYGVPIYGAGLIGLLTAQYQTMVIAFFSSKTAIGNYQVNGLFQTIFNTIIYPFITLFPAFSKLDPNGKEISQFFRRSVKYTALVVVPTAVAMIVMSQDLVLVFYGSAYTLAATFVAFNTLSRLFAGIGSQVFTYLFNGVGRPDITFKATLIKLAFILPLVPLLTMLYDIMGLITALILSGVVPTAYVLFIAIKKMHLSIDFRASAKIYVSSTISAIVVFIFLVFSPFAGLINLIFGSIFFIFTYLTLLPILGVLNSTDIEIFRAQFHNMRAAWPILKRLLDYEAKILNYAKKS